jgi:hypothetical protein
MSTTATPTACTRCANLTVGSYDGLCRVCHAQTQGCDTCGGPIANPAERDVCETCCPDEPEMARCSECGHSTHEVASDDDDLTFCGGYCEERYAAAERVSDWT